MKQNTGLDHFPEHFTNSILAFIAGTLLSSKSILTTQKRQFMDPLTHEHK